ncbi:uncharacterized protein LOC121875309 [Homarus americanus]|uniref:Putative DM4/DM12 family-like protein 11 n=1 Tax=Homarus americanus TaxID=6706 RepID=A0A8J5JUH8_HOMAM|nr:uncharacterized protein LOC121875309 [Homarus americanus]KAG7161218.1 putative DM4/DM12 family-like protein 11 [Homarus americanus]
MHSMIGITLLVCVAGGITLAEVHSVSDNDLLSAITWATLDLHNLPQPGLLTSLERLNMTSVDLDESLGSLASLEGLDLNWNDLEARNVTPRHSRRKRNLEMIFHEPGDIEVELKFIIPMFNVYESTNLNLELPFVFSMELPEEKNNPFIVGKKNDRRWDDTVGTMMADLETLVSMLGVDGGGCVRKALCELAAMPPITPQGLTGEMMQLLVRYMMNQVEGEVNAINLEERVTEKERENNKKEKLEEISVSEKPNGEEEKEDSQTKKQKEKHKDDEIRERKWKQSKDYVDATIHGKKNGDCWSAYPECPLSLMHLLSSY